MSLSNRQSLEPFISDDVDYYQHQVDGIRRMAGMKNVLLADDMGLGKTMQTLSLFALDIKRGLGSKMIVVCPASLKPNWDEEVAKFLNGKLIHCTVLKSTWTPAKRAKAIDAFDQISGPKILIVNYELLAKHLVEFNRIMFDIAVFDEAHYMKNTEAQRTKDALALWCKRAILVTGSPILNMVHELYPMLQKLEVDHLPNYYRYLNHFVSFTTKTITVTVKDKEGKSVKKKRKVKEMIGAKNVDELRAILGDYMVRRTKEQCLDLPPVQYIQRTVGMHGLQERYYKQLKNDGRIITPTGEELECDNPLVRFLRMKQICGTTACVPDETNDVSHKLDQACSDAYEIMDNGHRLVAFTQFLDVQSAFEARIRRYNMHAIGDNHANGGKTKPLPPVYILNGSVKSDDRQSVIRAWSLSQTPGILICTFKVAGVGLNMTAARHGLFLDKLFVPALNKQAVDRLHRIGADRSQPVQILEYFVQGTVEARVEAILKQKKELFDEIIDNNSPSLHSILRTVLEEDMAA